VTSEGRNIFDGKLQIKIDVSNGFNFFQHDKILGND